MRRVLLALLLVSSAAGATRADTGASRLAVLPFQNLNNDEKLAWMSLGIAETMVSDLKVAGKNVVERAQIDQALAELALQHRRGTDESTAAQTGKLVGATHVVVGGYQRSGDQVRLTARLVVVETGVVDTSAKVTGELTDVFNLQDQVVGQLFKLAAVKPRPAAKNKVRTLDAYKAYALSLATSSEAEKVEQLRRALDLDPDFHYALFDLRALESRLDRYAKRGRAVLDERTQASLAVVDNEKATPTERNMQAVMVMNGLMTQFRYSALLDVATRIYDMKIPEAPPAMPGVPPMRAREYAAYDIFLSLMMLKKNDLALQSGERYVAEYPAGTFAQSIDLQMRAMIDQAHRHEQALKTAEREIASLDVDERAADSKGKMSAAQRRSFAFRHCSVYAQNERWADAVDGCLGFAKDYKDAEDSDNLVKLARFLAMRAWSELGRFDEATHEADRLLDDFPDWAHQNSIDMLKRTYPQP